MKTIAFTDYQLEQVRFALQDRIGNLRDMIDDKNPVDPIRTQLDTAKNALLALYNAGFAPS